MKVNVFYRVRPAYGHSLPRYTTVTLESVPGKVCNAQPGFVDQPEVLALADQLATANNVPVVVIESLVSLP